MLFPGNDNVSANIDDIIIISLILALTLSFLGNSIIFEN